MKSVLLCLLLSLPIAVFSQTSTTPIDSSRTTFTISLKDGGQYVGRIVGRDSIKVVVRRKGGGLSYLAPSDITRIEPYQGRTRTREYKQPAVVEQPTEQPVATKTGDNNQFPWLLGNQTALPLKAGQLTYRNIWVLYNEVSYGLLGFITLRASVTPSFSGQTFYNSTLYTRPSVGGKLSIPLGNVHIGGDLSYRWTERSRFYFYDRGNFNQRERTLSGLITFGSTKSNLTLGYTNQKIENRPSDRNSVDIGFVAPIGRRLSLISDNRILIGKNSYDYDRFSQISGVLRLNRARHAFDLGVLIAIRDEDKLRFYPLPYVAYTMRLSRK